MTGPMQPGTSQGLRPSLRVWTFLALFLAAWLLGLTGFNSADEAWTMRVVHRVQAGTVLYRDVFLGVTPLSIWAGLGWVTLFGAGVVSFKALAAFQFAAAALLIQELAHRCGLRGAALIVLPLALLGSAWNPQASLYPGLASLGAIASLAALLRILQGDDRGTPRLLVWAGLFAGLAFAAKQTIGLFALGVAVASLPLLRMGLRSVLPLASGFLLGAFAPLIPVAWQGGLPGLWEYGFAGKGLYLRTTSFLYLESLGGLRSLLDPAATSTWFRQGVGGLSFLVPPIALATWLWPRRLRGEHKTATDLVGLSALAALAGTLPMADAYHLAFAMPQCVLLLLLSVSPDRPGERTPWRRWAVGMIGAWALLLVGGRFAGGAMRLLGHTAQPSRLPYFAGIPALPSERGGLESSLVQVGTVARGRPVFFLSRGASAWYLTTGLRNPTAYDYPTVPAFGRVGEARIISQIEQGEIPLVAVRADAIDRWPRTERLEAWIRRHMTAQGRAGEFELYGLPVNP